MKLRAFLALAIAAVAMALFGPATQASAYPAGVCSTLSVNTTNPAVGGPITVTGTGFLPNQAVKLILKSQTRSSEVYTLKTVTSSAAGAFTTTVTMPDATTNNGHYDIIAVSGYDTQGSCPADPFQNLTVGSASDGGSGSGGGSNGGGTAFTGVNVLLMVVVAGGLIVTGVAFNRRGASKRV